VARKTDPHARYRNAWQAGSSGRPLPPGLADMADSDSKIDQAYDAGQSQVPFSQFLSAQGLSSPQPSPSPSPSPRRSPGRQTSSRAPQGSVGRTVGSAANNLGSVLLGFVLAALGLSVLDYGAKGPLYWFQAKFLNDQIPASGKGSTPTSASTVGVTATNAVLG
jgi:hypothetical protein